MEHTPSASLAVEAPAVRRVDVRQPVRVCYIYIREQQVYLYTRDAAPAAAAATVSSLI